MSETDDLRAAVAALAAKVRALEDQVDHLADGPTRIYGSANPDGGSPLGALRRRDAVLAMSRGASVSSH